jgi:thiaminase/transcriptional activator TenA
VSAGLFERLKSACAEDWRGYVEHAFVRGVGDGSLPEASFRHYLIQDYLFLIHFTRAYGMAAFKAETLEDMREAVATAQMLVETEMRMHVRFCAGWGVSEAEMAATPEAVGTMAYTRFVLAKGLQGDLLDLKAALAPCVIGYGEIGTHLGRRVGPGNPYRAWIDMYAGDEYQEVAAAAARQLDRLGAERLTEARWPALAETFRQATRLEAAFWQAGLDRAP